MSTLSEIHLNYKQLLKDNPTKKQLWKIIHDFIRFYSAEGIKDELWMLTIGTLSSDEVEEMEKGIKRFNRIFFYEYSLLFIDAVNQLYQKQKSGTNKGKKKRDKVIKN